MSPVVMVVEDDFVLRYAAVEALVGAGFLAIEAEHAEEALAILNSRASAVHVLFTDIHMPGEMDGLALAHHTRRTWPWIALLVTSGTENVQRMPLPCGSRFLPKPYHVHDMAAHVRDLTAAA